MDWAKLKGKERMEEEWPGERKYTRCGAESEQKARAKGKSVLRSRAG